jgi:hypothetical protein
MSVTWSGSSTLGGQNLYGAGSDNFAIVMRELIQNARDAVAARRFLAQGFVGRILVKIAIKSDTQTFVEIQDDGVGMSERTVTGALLDFGTSFWASDLVRSEFPGLRSSSFRPVGRFGIGFYAVFMVASEVLVTSRRFDEGLADVTRLHFPSGLTLRPILAKGADAHCDAVTSTGVRLTIDEPIADIRDRWINKGNPEHEWRVPFQSYLAAITAGLDVSVELQIEAELPITVHESVNDLAFPQEKCIGWIRGISFADVPTVRGGAELKKYVSENADRIRPIEQNGRLVGLAALLDVSGGGLRFLTTDTIGGLTNHVSRGAGGYMGYMENYPASAKRDAGKKVASTETLQSWANAQVAILRARGATVVQLYWAASQMANLEIDSIDVISFPVFMPNNQGVLMPFEQIFNLLQQTSIVCIRSRQAELAEVNLQPLIIDGLPTLRPLSGGNLVRMHMENGRPKFPSSLIGCLDRLVTRRGRELDYELKPVLFQTMFGPLDALTIKMRAL